jgi:hypothetical protein
MNETPIGSQLENYRRECLFRLAAGANRACMASQTMEITAAFKEDEHAL